MDNNQFTTTFIPKKPMVAVPTDGAPVSKPVGLLSSVSLILFILTLVIAGGVYGWEQYEAQNVAVLASSVNKVETAFDPGLITQLQSLDKQLRNANLLLANHTVVSPIFDLLESSTLSQVQFTKFALSVDPVAGTQVKMSGIADSYRTIAQQSDVLGSSTFLTNTIFSNFFLTPQSQVSFDLSFGVTQPFLNFETAPLSSPNQSPAVSSASAPATVAPITVTSVMPATVAPTVTPNQ